MSLRRIIPALALILAGVPLAATAAPGSGPADPTVVTSDAGNPTVAEVKAALDVFVERWNDNQLEEMVAGHYTDDAVVIPPNHEPIKGHAAIVAFFKSVREVVGPFDEGDHLLEARAGDGTVSWVGQYNFRDGNVRLTSHELYVRHADGSMRCAVDMFGYRDPMK